MTIMRSYLIPILSVLFLVHVFFLDGSTFGHLKKKAAEIDAAGLKTEHTNSVPPAVINSEDVDSPSVTSHQEEEEKPSPSSNIHIGQEAVTQSEKEEQTEPKPVAVQVPTEPANLQTKQSEETPASETQESEDVPEKNEPCLKYILYDKPIKTGSTAITRGIRSFLEHRGETDNPCQNPVCSQKAQDICKGQKPPEHLLSHITIPDGTFYCLKNMGYYTVTSIRDPKDRWRSSYYYNVKRNASHYGISPTATYDEFLQKYPACALLHYYDGEGALCEVDGVEHEKTLSRIERIVDRYDEIIDLDESPNGPMHHEIEDYIREVNVAGKEVSDNKETPDSKRLTYELRLYEALREKRKVGSSGRALCKGRKEAS